MKVFMDLQSHELFTNRFDPNEHLIGFESWPMGWIPAQVLERTLDGADVRLISTVVQGFENGIDIKTPEGSLELTSLFGKINTSKFSIDLNKTQSLMTIKNVQDETS